MTEHGRPRRPGFIPELACAPVKRNGTKVSRAKKRPGKPSADALQGFFQETRAAGLFVTGPVYLRKKPCRQKGQDLGMPFKSGQH